MNVEYFIAKRLFYAKEKNNRYTRPIFYIAILAITLSISIMLLSIVVLNGFKDNISKKAIGFKGHISITNFTDNQSFETEPISINQPFYPNITTRGDIKNINVFATKAGIIKTNDEILGVMLKGVSSDYDWDFFKKNLIRGEVLNINDTIKTSHIFISKYISDILKIDVGDDLFMYFIQKPNRVIKFLVKGIYNTSLTEFDKLFVLADIRHIQRLNKWSDTQVGGFEITIDNFDKINFVTNQLYKEINYNLNAENIKDKNPQLFAWLDLQDMNVVVILIIMLIVGGVNMITALLILILEKTKLIGILKAIGISNWSVRKIFLYNGLFLILQGIFFGNLIGLGLAYLQKRFSLISLDPKIYYMETVPVVFDMSDIILLNLATIVICYLILIIPSVIITKISPVKAIRFE